MLDKLAIILGPAAIALGYSLGYAYLDGYYSFYDISLSEFNPGLEQVLVHSIPPIKAENNLLYSIILIFTVIIMAVVYTQKLLGRFLPLFLLFASVISICLAVLLVDGAPDAGQDQALADYTMLHRVIYDGEPGSDFVEEMLAGAPRASLHHLVSTPTIHYIVVKIDGGDRRWTIRLPRTETGTLAAYQP